MSSSQVYPALTGTIDPGHMSSDATAGIVGTEWYAPTSYAYTDPYITPYPSSTVEGQPWSQFARASVPELHLGAYTIPGPQPPQSAPMQMMKDPGRPRSSPSTFGPSAESMTWPASGLGIRYISASGQPTPPVTSTFPSNVFQTFPMEDNYNASSPSEIRQPQPRRPYTNIAPTPPSAPSKRKRGGGDDDDQQETPASTNSKRRKRTSSVVSQDLSEDDKFLVQLKEDSNLPWKDIATRFQTDKGKSFQVAALQMRYKRLREKFRIWEDQDIYALKQAHEYWEKYKWEIIAGKMLEFGISERWPARHAARKFQDLEAASSSHAIVNAAGLTPASISLSSPVEGPVHFAFMPLPQ